MYTFVSLTLSSLLLSVYAAPLDEATALLKRANLAQVISKCTAPKTVALTFDDGPYIYNAQLVKLLNDNGAKGTFAVNGNNYACIYDSDSIARIKNIYNSGHQIISHTWSHPHLTQLNYAQQTKELQLVDLALQRILGITPAFMRPPYGEYNSVTQQAAYDQNKKVVIWDFDSLDSDGATPAQSKSNYDKIIAQKPSNILALNHETEQGTVTTVMPYAIQKLKAAGYKLVTLSECLGNSVAPYTKITSPQPGSYSCDDTTIPPPTPPPSSGSVQIHPNGDNSWCVVAQSNSNNAAVVLQKCSSSSTKWAISRGQTPVTTNNGALSFDAGSAKPADGFQMKIYQSYSGIAAQTFYYTDDNRIALANSGKCLDLPSGNKVAGQRLQLYACGTGNNNQVWTTTS